MLALTVVAGLARRSRDPPIEKTLEDKAPKKPPNGYQETLLRGV